MFTLIRHNVVKEVASEPGRDKLLGQGYTLVEDIMTHEPVLDIEFKDESVEAESVVTQVVEEKANPVKRTANKGKNSK